MKNKQLKHSEKNYLAAIFFVFGALHIYSTIKAERKNYFQLLKKFKPLWPSISIGLIFVSAIELLQRYQF